MKHILIAAATMLSGIFILIGLEGGAGLSHDALLTCGFIWGFICPLILNYWLLERDNKSK